jgi:hypothetical protein
MAGSTEVSPKDLALVVALAAGETYEVAGEQAGVAERTVQRRMADPAFRALVEELQVERWEGARRRLFAAAPKAAATLEELATDAEAAAHAGAGVRFRAAQAVLQYADLLGKSSELEERLAVLEERAGIDTRTGWKAAA